MISGDDVELYAKIGGGIGAAIYVAFTGRSWIKRRLSTDGVVVAEDNAAINMLQRALDQAEKERRRADEAFEQRNVAIQEIGTLRAQVKNLEERRDECDRRIEQAQQHCDRRIEEMERQLEMLRAIVERRLHSRDDKP